jgi:hypothetical protein
MPGPLYVPPAGDPCVKLKVGIFTHTGAIAAKVTVGKGFTVIARVAVFTQPLPSV